MFQEWADCKIQIIIKYEMKTTTLFCFDLKHAWCLKRKPKRSNILLTVAGIWQGSFSKHTTADTGQKKQRATNTISSRIQRMQEKTNPNSNHLKISINN